jgi:hypothetical protein
MKISLTVLILTLLFSINACSDKDEDLAKQTTPGDHVNIRIMNASNFDYSDVYVNTSGHEFNYGTIGAGRSTGYQGFDRAYSYAYIELKIDGMVYRIQPVDFVGEKELEDGNYTYQINAKQEGGEYDRLTLTLISD